LNHGADIKKGGKKGARKLGERTHWAEGERTKLLYGDQRRETCAEGRGRHQRKRTLGKKGGEERTKTEQKLGGGDITLCSSTTECAGFFGRSVKGVQWGRGEGAHIRGVEPSRPRGIVKWDWKGLGKKKKPKLVQGGEERGEVRKKRMKRKDPTMKIEFEKRNRGGETNRERVVIQEKEGSSRRENRGGVNSLV